MSARVTPTTAEVRAAWAYASTGHESTRTDQQARDLFDRWLEALIAQVRVDTLRDAAAQARKGWAPYPCPWVGFLDDRADRIEGAS